MKKLNYYDQVELTSLKGDKNYLLLIEKYMCEGDDIIVIEGNGKDLMKFLREEYGWDEEDTKDEELMEKIEDNMDGNDYLRLVEL